MAYSIAREARIVALGDIFRPCSRAVLALTMMSRPVAQPEARRDWCYRLGALLIQVQLD
jgi:hypothetical protein